MNNLKSLLHKTYNMRNLEIRINPQTSDVIIFSQEENPHLYYTIKNIEKKNEIAHYGMEISRDKTILRRGDKAYQKYAENGYTLETSLENGIFCILGVHFEGEKSFTKKELKELKEKLKEKLKEHQKEGKNYIGIYEISYMNSYKGKRYFEGKKYVYVEQVTGQRIFDKSQTEGDSQIPAQYLIGMEDDFLDCMLYAKEYPTKSNKYAIKIVAPSSNDIWWPDKIPYTKSALNNILDRYKRIHNRYGTQNNNRGVCKRVETPIVPIDMGNKNDAPNTNKLVSYTDSRYE